MGKPLLGVCAILRGERPYVREWLAWHRHMGVDVFYLYDNGDGLGDMGLGSDVVVRPWGGTGAGGQLMAYVHGMWHAESEWLCVLDGDEFVYAPEGGTLRGKLEQARELAGCEVDRVWMPWRMFGWKPHAKRPAAPGEYLVTEAYQWRLPDDAIQHGWWLGKSCLKVEAWNGVMDNPHHIETAGTVWMDSGLVVNHYWSKSWQDVQEKVQRGRSDEGTRSWWEFLAVEPKRTPVLDTGLAEQVRAAGITVAGVQGGGV